MAAKMSVVKVYSCFTDGTIAIPSEIEVSVSPGIPIFDVIGLCDSSIRESRGRIHTALVSSGYTVPKGHITVSISPAYLRKSGSFFDLPIAIGMLLASKQIRINDEVRIYAEGELSLTGDIKGAPGASLRLMKASEDKYDIVLYPEEEILSAQCAQICGMGISHLSSVGEVLSHDGYKPVENMLDSVDDTLEGSLDISVIRGQEKAKRAMLLSACGKHSALFLGSPGCGKTMVGKMIHSLLPPMNRTELREVYSRFETAGINRDGDLISSVRPFRYVTPLTTAGRLLGSAASLSPGELALANHGVLFADEICEYTGGVLDALRIPLESKKIQLVKNGKSYDFNASFIFVAAGNPCRCGNLYEDDKKCKCTPLARMRYVHRLSGPFLDRIDLFTEMKSLSPDELREINEYQGDGNDNEELRRIVASVWEIQKSRYRDIGENVFNGSSEIDIPKELFRADKRVFEYAVDMACKCNFSARGLNRLLRVGRTVADIDGRDDMRKSDITEAVMYRDRSQEA